MAIDGYTISLVCWTTLLVAAPLISCQNTAAKQQVCTDRGKTIVERVGWAEVILTGTVVRLFKSTHFDYQAHVHVKRLMKTVIASKHLDRNTPILLVDGFGDSRICNTAIREQDTKIFMLVQGENGTLRLNSSLITVTLWNLEKVEAAIRDIPYKNRLAIQKTLEPCEQLLCGFGAVCQLNETSQTAYCECRQVACDQAFMPVCGTDNVTYTSECQLSAASCRTQKRIRVAFRGTCDAKDPCEKHKCYFGATCQRSIDGRSAQCVCPDKCPYYGDATGSRPVCATDGNDYESECEMKRAACAASKEINVYYTGKCDPCAGVVCPAGTTCKLNERMRDPVCKCSSNCVLNGDFVCASDGKTYLNECVMNAQACKEGRDLRVYHKGKCKPDNVCNTLDCKYGQQCYIDKYNRSSCQCTQECEPIVKHVCGKDGVTYENKCQLELQACKKAARNAMFHEGPCGKGVCRSHHCPYGSICVEVKGQPVCQCPACSSEYAPVCGSNGITYENECRMRHESCTLNETIYAKYDGICEGCRTRKCDYYSLCVSDNQGNATCVCPSKCVKADEPVCGTDGVTYANECELQVAACKESVFKHVASKGSCDACVSVQCDHGAHCENGKCVCPTRCPSTAGRKELETCGSDGRLYESACHLEQAACELNVRIYPVAPYRCPENLIPVDLTSPESCSPPCEFGAMCFPTLDAAHECICYFECNEGVATANPMHKGRVCGTDGNWYASICAMDEASCKLQKAIHTDSPERCSVEVPEMVPCALTKFGCCHDNKSTALGPEHAGCEGECHCNRAGSLSETCDINGQCTCKPGVMGAQCNRCMPGYYGLNMIVRAKNPGCIPCGCSAFGSARDDCDQDTGKCMCRRGVLGMKCNTCPPGQMLKPEGCVDKATYTHPRTCDDLKCQFGAVCVAETPPRCQCVDACPTYASKYPNETVGSAVCGSDFVTYASECALRTVACHMQIDLVVSMLGACPNIGEDGQTKQGKTKTTRELITSRMSQPTALPKGLMDSCNIDSECAVEFTHCLNQKCVCLDGYQADWEHRVCKKMQPVPDHVFSPCHSKPCRNFGTCRVSPSAEDGYTCACPIQYTGKRCEEMLHQPQLYTLPEFGGHSYLEMAKLDAYSHVLIRLQFKPMESSGLILYNGQRADVMGDFISVAMVDGFLQFRYNLGDGVMLLASAYRLALNEWHRAELKRHGRSGRMVVDDQPAMEIVDDVSGGHRDLNLETPLFVGKVPHMPSHVKETVLTDYGFIGCILSLEVNDVPMDLRVGVSTQIIKHHQMGQCGVNPCSSLPCTNGGSCEMLSDTQFRCVCRHGYTGTFCESTNDGCLSMPCQWGGTCQALPSNAFKCICPQGRTGKVCGEATPSVEDHRIYLPQFHGESYLELPPLTDGSIADEFSAEIWFMPYFANGLLLFVGSGNGFWQSREDFISVSLQDGYVQFFYQLGSGLANLTSRQRVTMGQWSSVSVSRLLRNGSLTVNDAVAVVKESPPDSKQLNVDKRPVFIGGLRAYEDLALLNGHSKGFQGVIQRVVLNGQVYDDLVKAASYTSGVSQYVGLPCEPNPCKNQGICVGKLKEFECRCPRRYWGDKCDEYIQKDELPNGRPVKFMGKYALRYRNDVNKKQKHQEHNYITLRVKTNATSGLLFWQGTGLGKGDYLALALREGYPELSFDLGNDKARPFSVIADSYVADNKWHVVQISRSLRQGSLQVDNGAQRTSVSAFGSTQLNTDGFLWLGGVAPNVVPSMLADTYRTKFVGCMAEVKVASEFLDLVTDADMQKLPNDFEFCES